MGFYTREKLDKAGIRETVISNGAPAIMRDRLSAFVRLLIVCDHNTYEVFGREAADMLRSPCCVIPCGQSVLIPDEKAVGYVENALRESGAEHIVGVGSGVINDVCKYVSFANGLSYSIFATAASMDGYASSSAAMLFRGLKTTYPAHAPLYIFASPRILAAAPREMTAAGAGDILGKFSCLNDWKLSAVVTGESLDPEIYGAVMREALDCAGYSSSLGSGNEASAARLMRALVNVGVCMALAGSSRPASGAEHHIAHFFEIKGLLDSRPYLSHGADVAYSTAVTAYIRERLAEEDFSGFKYSFDPVRNSGLISRTFGDSAPELIEIRDRLDLYADRLDVIKDREREIKKVLREAPGFKETVDMLSRAGFDLRDFVKHYGPEYIRLAITRAMDLKDRYTVLRLCENAGLLERYAASFSDLMQDMIRN